MGAAQFDIICFYGDYVSSASTSSLCWKKCWLQAFPCVQEQNRRLGRNLLLLQVGLRHLDADRIT